MKRENKDQVTAAQLRMSDLTGENFKVDTQDSSISRFYQKANWLALITIYYNLVEGAVSVFFGFQDETLSLFGFGLDSFVEVISGIGVWHMIRRLRQSTDGNPDRFEQRALKTTGAAFILLTVGLTASAVYNIYSGHHPETTFWGIVISLISIGSMWALIHFKVKVGTALNSQAILADAGCTRACMILSGVLLAASLIYEVTGFGGADSIGSIFIAWLAFREGREAFEKANGISCGCGKIGCGTKGEGAGGRMEMKKNSGIPDHGLSTGRNLQP
jgi:divalent metal cation (Fe/Co/Zn/Cd) transporter